MSLRWVHLGYGMGGADLGGLIRSRVTWLFTAAQLKAGGAVEARLNPGSAANRWQHLRTLSRGPADMWHMGMIGYWL